MGIGCSTISNRPRILCNGDLNEDLFQKIADPSDIAPTAGVAFTINHIAAVFIPVLFGLIWVLNPAAVFLAGAAMAFVSLILARMVPLAPDEGNEFVWSVEQPKA